MSYKGRITILDSGEVQEELMNGSTVERTLIAYNDGEANAMIIVWVIKKVILVWI